MKREQRIASEGQSLPELVVFSYTVAQLHSSPTLAQTPEQDMANVVLGLNPVDPKHFSFIFTIEEIVIGCLAARIKASKDMEL